MSSGQTEQVRRNLVESLRDRGYVYTNRVERAMQSVPRHEFVPLIGEHGFAKE
ncbi:MULTISPECIES: hypothetical protein [Haloferax]|uniref:Protein-L-isoaspartate O-methyltransferase n=1 Tax=Haloferax marinum TaxID=2666143 RepID=A0A6A8G9J4_9EURY|nr:MULTISPECIES: hypothetical protein [Haloferax]KAB1198571.1 hypothetical protein Hfx1150_14025 [Haloferax sp. CBA1150]MRW97681.1 hypothetical protein [Haloferax marinum]